MVQKNEEECSHVVGPDEVEYQALWGCCNGTSEMPSSSLQQWQRLQLMAQLSQMKKVVEQALADGGLERNGCLFWRGLEVPPGGTRAEIQPQSLSKELRGSPSTTSHPSPRTAPTKPHQMVLAGRPPPGLWSPSLTSSPAQAPSQIIACSQGQDSHWWVLHQVCLVCNSMGKRGLGLKRLTPCSSPCPSSAGSLGAMLLAGPPPRLTCGKLPRRWADNALQEHGCSSLTYAVQDPAHCAVTATGQDAEIWSVPKEAQPRENRETRSDVGERWPAG